MYLTRKEKNTALSQRNPAQEKKRKGGDSDGRISLGRILPDF